MIEIPTRAPGQVGRERIVPVLREISDVLVAILARLDALEQRPSAVTVREWKPDHRRLVDGGTQVRKQRRRVKALKP